MVAKTPTDPRFVPAAADDWPPPPAPLPTPSSSPRPSPSPTPSPLAAPAAGGSVAGLRGGKPLPTSKRLKMFLYGGAGVGKTTAALQFPAAYIIDCERGTENYDAQIAAAGSAVFQTTDFEELVTEVRSLLTVPHPYRTLVIDPITPVFNDLVEKAETIVGTAHGRHYGEANKRMKRLANLILALDMNVIVTAHAKKEYGANMSVIGQTFDGWRALDYWFDLVVELQKRGKRRVGRVVKTRLERFPDEDVFDWNYELLRDRWGRALVERPAGVLALATAGQVQELQDLLAAIRLPAGTTDKWLAKAGVDRFEDMPAEQVAKCVEYLRDRFPAADCGV